jgi:hypothetical protein
MSSDTITYYYNKNLLINGEYVNNGTETNNVTDNGEYSGYSSIPGSFLTGGLDYSLVFNYSGFRTPEGYKFPAYFTEVLDILKDDSFLSCTKTYQDSGSGATTSVPFNIFVVTGASGIFEGYKYVKISYFPDFTRVVEISKNL